MTVAAVGAALAGCGGGSSGGGAASGAALTRAQIIEQANTICAAEETAGEKIPTPDDIQDAKQAAAYFDQVDPLISSTTDKLAALQPDSEVAGDWNAFISLRKSFTAKMHAIRDKADAADRSGLQDLQNLSTDDLAAAADKVGAKTCNES
ncbi:MAG TPA: hypothetical protein VHA79_05895 [Mycobacteriales bacterium]|jgi:hypothetical protein|nr:hypothetical protein [Mycobacteriales bacterium]